MESHARTCSGTMVYQAARGGITCGARPRFVHRDGEGALDSKRLEDAFGGRWTGVRLLWEPTEVAPAAGRFCDLIGHRDGARMVTSSTCMCPGAAYAFGWQPEAAKTIAGELQAKLGLPQARALVLLKSLPQFEQPPQGVLVGVDGDADIYVSYAQPLSVMKLVRRWHALQGSTLSTRLSSVMSVCSGAALAAYLDRRPALTFGCPESRNAGGLSRDRLALAVPGSLVDRLTGA